MDRPPRKTKLVNYRENIDFDDDEDFACVKAPPSKKAREDVKHEEPKKSSHNSATQETNSLSTLDQKSRKPVDQKVYERDLDAAITLSLLNNADGMKGQSPSSQGFVKVQLPVAENTDFSSIHMSNCSVNAAVLGLDEITSEKGSLAAPVRRKAAVEEQRKNLKGEDEEYQPKLTPDSESGEDFSTPDESEDEEFAVRKVSKTKMKEKVNKKGKTKSPSASKKEKQPPKSNKSVAAASAPVRSPSAAKPAARRPSSPVVSKPTLPLSPAGGRIPKWNPPGQLGKSPSSSQNPAGKSPGQGLRLGLSRRVRVKPLHPSVASH